MRRRSAASKGNQASQNETAVADYEAIDETTADANKNEVPPFEKSVFCEAFLPLIYSGLVYDISAVMKFARENHCAMMRPEDFPDDVDLLEFMSKSADFKDFNNENGLSLSQLLSFVSTNVDAITEQGQYFRFLVKAAKDFANHTGKYGDDGGDNSDHDRAWLNGCFLRFHRCLRGNKACVYSIFKDTLGKKITAVFRGSTGPTFFNRTTRDWTMNLKFYAAQLPTPDAVKDKMKGVLKERVLVHRGFRDYIWANEYIEGPQRAEMIYNDIKAAIGGEEGYSVCLSGHSLGGALATMSAFMLAGYQTPPDTVPIPKPITCITFAAPYSGTYGYRLATEHLEREGFLRSVRFNLPGDGVPKILPFTIGWPIWPFRLMKHTGINVRMTNAGCHIEHTSRANFFTAIRNGLLDLVFWLGIFRVGEWHYIRPAHIEALSANEETLKKVTIDDLYNDKTVVSKKFLEGNF